MSTVRSQMWIQSTARGGWFERLHRAKDLNRTMKEVEEFARLTGWSEQVCPDRAMLECSLWKNLLDLWSETGLG